MLKNIVGRHIPEPEPENGVDIVSPQRYRILRRKIVALMAVVSILPLLTLAAINYYEHQATLTGEIQNPLRVLVSKTRNSFEIFLAERTSTVSLIASAYPFEDLANEKVLNRIFQVMRREFVGFVDLALIDSKGDLRSYVGPYDLRGRNYAEQAWFHQVSIKGKYMSDVFMGFRKFPHVVIAVQHTGEDGRSWVLRATIDTSQFDRIIAAMSLEPGGDAFLVNREGVLQTDSLLYGKVLDKLPFPMPAPSFETNVVNILTPAGEEAFLSYTYFADADFVLMAVKPRPSVLQTWYSVRIDLLIIFLAGVAAIFVAVYQITNVIIRRLRESDERRLSAIHQMEHTQKLSSIGRLAAGVAHEINNPLAIINEKAGLMRDLIGLRPDFPDKERFLAQVDAIIASVNRGRSITQRMLGFARRMDVKIEPLDINRVLTETMGFLEREAQYRNVSLERELAEGLPPIPSDQGQIQQVFLNVLNNALFAVADGGHIRVVTADLDEHFVAVSIQDDGCGMCEETVKHMFEPFFTTKKDKGTGLGMSITYGIVKRLGGEIQVSSKQGEGTTITILLPKKQAEG
ncbi:ATP-binding protein [Desulfovibrio aminophilus]|nr:PAS domain-containing sensor histidine kinase [Desulfovibrio aminophilus]MCM0755784.1 ATP-binding protein [Desulfovibrio aminophilus]